MMPETIFDHPEYMRINSAREEWLVRVLSKLPCRSQLSTALDLGCGAGYFSGLLHRLGFRVTGLDLRPSNIALCRRRYPECTFRTINLDHGTELTPDSIGTFDLVLMFGLLYHLQSPLQVILRLAPCIRRVGLIGTRVAPGDALACYFYKEFEGDDQNEARIVVVPTFAAVAGTFAWAGLQHVYLPDFQPCHEQWDPQRYQSGLRRQFVVSREPIPLQGFNRVDTPAPLTKW